MRKGIHVGPGVLRTMIALFTLAMIVVVVKEMPAMRRYMKARSM
ncbi:hypothetical protein [Actinomadura sp. KC345]|nr:hypothetical protein [Actinomadura sp. KC345]